MQHPQTLGQSIKMGFGWGIGTSIARRIFGPPETVNVIHTNEAYTKCLEEKKSKEECEKYTT